MRIWAFKCVQGYLLLSMPSLHKCTRQMNTPNKYTSRSNEKNYVPGVGLSVNIHYFSRNQNTFSRLHEPRPPLTGQRFCMVSSCHWSYLHWRFTSQYFLMRKNTDASQQCSCKHCCQCNNTACVLLLYLSWVPFYDVSGTPTKGQCTQCVFGRLQILNQGGWIEKPKWFDHFPFYFRTLCISFAEHERSLRNLRLDMMMSTNMKLL